VFWLIAIASVTFLGLAKGGFTGVGVVATPLLALVLPPLQAAAILLPILLLQDIITVWVYRRDWDATNLRALLPGAFVGIAAAWALAAYVSDAQIRLVVGLIGVSFVLYRWLVAPQTLEVTRPHPWSGPFWGAMSGFTSTFAHAGGPPYQVYMLPQRLAKMTYAGTTTMFFACVNYLKAGPYFMLGQFSPENLQLSLALIPLAIFTNLAGIWLIRRTPQAIFYRIVYILTFAVSLELIRNGVTTMLG
jgi:uncharacterized membrane protein YfcA